APRSWGICAASVARTPMQATYCVLLISVSPFRFFSALGPTRGLQEREQPLAFWRMRPHAALWAHDPAGPYFNRAGQLKTTVSGCAAFSGVARTKNRMLLRSV